MALLPIVEWAMDALADREAAGEGARVSGDNPRRFCRTVGMAVFKIISKGGL